MSSKV